MGEHVFKDHAFLVAVDDIGIENLRVNCLEIIRRYHLQVGELLAILWGDEKRKSDGHFLFLSFSIIYLKYVIHFLGGVDYFDFEGF